MDRHERMRSGDWPQDDATSDFRRMPGRERLSEAQRELLEDVGRVALAVAVLALLAAFVR
jgi:hypothetical protein